MEILIEMSFNTFYRTNGYGEKTIFPICNTCFFCKKGFKQELTAKELTKALLNINFIKQKDSQSDNNKNESSNDFNSIAKGYAIDSNSIFSNSKHSNNFSIIIDTDIITKGRKPNEDCIVEMQNSYSTDLKRTYKSKLKNKALTLSIKYAKQLKICGQQISAFITNKTGFLLKNMSASVKLIAKTALEFDVLDNYLVFLKQKHEIQFIENQNSLESYLVYVENNVFKELKSSGFNNYIYNVTN